MSPVVALRRCPQCRHGNSPHQQVCVACGVGDLRQAPLEHVDDTGATVEMPRDEVLGRVASPATAEPLEPVLILELVSDPTLRFAVKDGQVVGRRDDTSNVRADVLLEGVPELAKISRRHCRVTHHHGRWFAQHLGRVNYIAVDGVRHHGAEPALLQPGCILELALTAFRVVVED